MVLRAGYKPVALGLSSLPRTQQSSLNSALSLGLSSRPRTQQSPSDSADFLGLSRFSRTQQSSSDSAVYLGLSSLTRLSQSHSAQQFHSTQQSHPTQQSHSTNRLIPFLREDETPYTPAASSQDEAPRPPEHVQDSPEQLAQAGPGQRTINC